MKMNNLLYVSLIALFTLFLSSCGDDTVTNNNNGNGNNTLIFSLDSLSINGTGFMSNSIFQSIVNQANDTMKITFRLESNCDASDSAYADIMVADTLGTYFFNSFNNINQFNIDYTSYFRVTSPNTAFAGLVRFNSITIKFLRFKNIKIYKIS